MRLSTFAAVLTTFLPSLVSATYFTSPVAGTTWDQAIGQTITWHYQPGGAPRGDIVLQIDTRNPKAAQTLVVATDVDLTSERVTVSADVGFSRANSWILRMVNSDDYSSIYTQVTDLTINSFRGSVAPSSTTPAATTTRGSGGAVGNGSGQDDDPASNPPVRTSTSATSSRESSSAETTSTDSSSTETSSTDSSSTESPSSSSSSSSSSPSSTQLVTATVLSTASGVFVTLQPSTSSGGPISIVTVTAASGSIASPAAAGSTSAAGRALAVPATAKWGAVLAAGAIGAACLL
ncbi:hypothetical protein DMC30DRAFT_414017 [Rhodotorula diobovata]|uniref:Ser-Thr-rich glycosyl-phosphatidyl-inositol-anchored membrane family-domain-containing protein n=1 Tax=Rhodotorula diobovata TaxID=5288 RepID=A0A5C5G3K4_9BASI|nr:hypothetical protein DMC30DRAFT_414017 [Rhodotorula diobovata]